MPPSPRTKHRAKPSAPLAPGTCLLPGYEVVAHLHRGAAFDTYDVWSEARACRCVAKVLRPDHLDDAHARRHLQREGRLLQGLSHRHIVRAYEYLVEPTAIIMETLTGATLAYLLEDSRKGLPIRDVAHLGLQLCSAMHYLHGEGFLHLDLKPGNIMCQSDVVKVFDLSIARPPGRGRKGAGTREYMAPEQARGGILTAATDVWGIGVVLHESVTGRPVFERLPSGYDQLQRRAEPIMVPSLPAPFAHSINRCLEPEPKKRPTIAELSETIAGIVGSPKSATFPE